MTINDIRNGDSLTVELEGRLDTLSSPELNSHLAKYYTSITDLTIDMGKLEYMSSAGLRVILIAQRAMQDKGGVLIRHANKLIMEVFNVTGFGDILRFEE